MISLPLLYRNSSQKKLFLTFPLINNFALFNITPIIRSLPIFFKLTTFNYIFFQNLTLTAQFREVIQIYSLFIRKKIDTVTNLFGVLKSLALYSFPNSLKLKSYLLPLPLRIIMRIENSDPYK